MSINQQGRWHHGADPHDEACRADGAGHFGRCIARPAAPPPPAPTRCNHSALDEPDSPPLRQLIAEWPAWIARVNPGNTGLEQALSLAEEAGEVARAVLKDHQGRRKTHAEWMTNLAEELGDVAINLVALAHLYGLDLEAAIGARWAEKRTAYSPIDRPEAARRDEAALI